MLLSYDILCVEGRSLGLRKGLRHAKCCNPEGKSIARNSTKENSASTSNPLHHTIKTSEGVVDAFRPTNPGHSPVVQVEGRLLNSELCKKCSKNNDNTTDLNVPENGNHGLAAGQEQTSKVNNLDDFRPTEPGHSPATTFVVVGGLIPLS
ncbi:unnamed protein product [Dovyalis caffra]|uniref:Uncharacterized protein n=1 Tax=Dovyalis caffra TaxID=77055 RepID=A0AAV1RPH2_9ROSI|nr:unnamed protein product [Dovyalis caffra]